MKDYRLNLHIVGDSATPLSVALNLLKFDEPLGIITEKHSIFFLPLDAPEAEKWLFSRRAFEFSVGRKMVFFGSIAEAQRSAIQVNRIRKLGNGEGANLYYCGQNVGVDALPGSDGTCGPNNGPQCTECKQYQKSQSENCVIA